MVSPNESRRGRVEARRWSDDHGAAVPGFAPWVVRLKRSSAEHTEDDTVIDLRDRLAPYLYGDPRPDGADGLVTAEVPRAKQPKRARSPRPRHLAPNHPAVSRRGLRSDVDRGHPSSDQGEGSGRWLAPDGEWSPPSTTSPAHLDSPRRGVIPPPPGAPISPPPGAGSGAATAVEFTTDELLIALGRQVVMIRKAVQLLVFVVTTAAVIGLIWALVIVTGTE